MNDVYNLFYTKMTNSWSSCWHILKLKLGCWNCFSYSNERHEYCKSLNYDILALTELHNKQNRIKGNELWVASPQAVVDEQGKCMDKAAG